MKSIERLFPILVLTAAPGFAAAAYRVTPITGCFAIGAYVYREIENRASILSDSGQVAGTMPCGGLAAVWSNGSINSSLGNLGGNSSYAFGVNASGQVVGKANTASGGPAHAFLSSNGTMHDLGTLPGGSYAAAMAINSSGQVAGDSSNTSNSGFTDAVLWSNGTIIDLGHGNWYASNAMAINDSGQVAGSGESGNTSHALLWTNGILTDLQTLGGNSSQAVAINNAGQVVGWAQNASGATRAFLYANGAMRDLGTLAGQNSQAHGINNAGQIVGMSDSTTKGVTHAFLYSNGVMTDLNTLIDPSLGITLAVAGAINNSGQILAVDTNNSTYLLTLGPPPTISPSASSLSFTATQGAANPAAQTVTLSNSGGGTMSWTATASTTSGGNWLSVAPASGFAPSTLTVTVNSGGLSPGTYNGTVQVRAFGASNTPLNVPVTLTVGVPAAPSLVFTPPTLGFPVITLGQSSSLALRVANSGTASAAFTAFNITGLNAADYAIVPGATTCSSSAPLAVGANCQITVSFAPAAIGLRNASLSIADNVAGSPQTVTLLGTGNATMSLGSSALSFNAVQGGGAPPGQSLTLSSTGSAPVSWTATASTSSGGNWLSVTPASGTAPSTLTVSVNPAALVAGTYAGTIQVNSAGVSNSPQTAAVTLTVSAPVPTAPSLSFSPTALAFPAVAIGQSTSLVLRVTNATSSAAATFTSIAINGSNSSEFTIVASGTTCSTSAPLTAGASCQITVSFAPAGPGARTASLVLSDNAPGSPQSISLSGSGAAGSGPAVSAVRSSAVNASGIAAISPGEWITITGNNLGPAQPATFTTSNGAVSSSLGGVSVLFDNIAGTPVYVSPTQINVIVPWEIGGRTSTNLTVSYNGTNSAPLRLEVVPVAPAIFTQDSSGSGQAAALNLTSAGATYNGPAGGYWPGTTIPTTPALPGTSLMLLLTGAGSTSPPGVTGTMTPNSPLMYVQGVSATIGGQPAAVQFAGAAPGILTGIAQINLAVPNVSGAALPVVISVGGTPSQTTATVAVQSTTPSGASITLLPTAATVPVGATQQFSAAATGASNTAVTWSVNGIAGGNTSAGTVSSSGLYTAPAAVPNPATVTVQAASAANPAVSASAAVTVVATARPPFIISLSSPFVDPFTLLTITGSGFDAAATVNFAVASGTSYSIPPLVVSPTTIVVSVPPLFLGARFISGPVNVTVQQASGTSAPAPMQITALAAVPSLAPGTVTLGFLQGLLAAATQLGSDPDASAISADLSSQSAALTDMIQAVQALQSGAASSVDLGTWNGQPLSLTVADLAQSDSLLVAWLQVIANSANGGLPSALGQSVRSLNPHAAAPAPCGSAVAAAANAVLQTIKGTVLPLSLIKGAPISNQVQNLVFAAESNPEVSFTVLSLTVTAITTASAAGVEIPAAIVVSAAGVGHALTIRSAYLLFKNGVDPTSWKSVGPTFSTFLGSARLIMTGTLKIVGAEVPLGLEIWSAMVGTVGDVWTLLTLRVSPPPPEPAACVSATAIGFGTVNVGSSATAPPVTLTNPGSAPLTITAIGITTGGGGNASVNANADARRRARHAAAAVFSDSTTCPTAPQTLAPGANCTITASFAPQVAGDQSAAILVSGSALGLPQTIVLSGTGAGSAPAPAVLTAVTVAPGSVTGGNSAGGTVTLSAPAPAGGAAVSLQSSNPAAAQVPATVTIPAGQTSATFAVTTAAVNAPTGVTISASLAGVTQSASFTVNPAPAAITVTGLTLSSSAVTGGNSVTATVTLSGAAPAGGIVVSLQTSNGAAAQVPPSVTVSAGSNSASFAVTASIVTSQTAVTITALLAPGAPRSASLVVNPAPSGSGSFTYAGSYHGMDTETFPAVNNCSSWTGQGDYQASIQLVATTALSGSGSFSWNVSLGQETITDTVSSSTCTLPDGSVHTIPGSTSTDTAPPLTFSLTGTSDGTHITFSPSSQIEICGGLDNCTVTATISSVGANLVITMTYSGTIDTLTYGPVPDKWSATITVAQQ